VVRGANAICGVVPQAERALRPSSGLAKKLLCTWVLSGVQSTSDTDADDDAFLTGVTGSPAKRLRLLDVFQSLIKPWGGWWRQPLHTHHHTLVHISIQPHDFPTNRHSWLVGLLVVSGM
jgi:hypothetical protein